MSLTVKLARMTGFALLLIAVTGCATFRLPWQKAIDPELKIAAESGRQWTGVAVSREGRVFVNFPRWSEQTPVSVAEIQAGGQIVPYPNLEWNNWDPSQSPQRRFVCVQSVYIDDQNFLWVLDPANPQFQGVVPGGPKLIKIDLRSNRIVQVTTFSEEIAPKDSYLNDVRIDTKRNVAYITDSGNGAIIVVDLATGDSRRLLDHHSSTHSEGVKVDIDGTTWTRPDGSFPDIHADGIALSSDRRYLYYHALTANWLYRIQTRWLLDQSLSDPELAHKVEFVAKTGPVDGIIFGPFNNLYLSDLEGKRITYLTPLREYKTLVRDDRLQWPDTFAVGPANDLYVTTSQIHLGRQRTEPYRLFKIHLDEGK